MPEISTAATRLADLRAAILDGEDVSPADLAAATAAVEHEQLVGEGRRRRSDRKAAEKAAERREQAKRAAAALLADHSLDDALTAFDAAVAAIDQLHARVTAYDDAVHQAAKILDDAGVPAEVLDHALTAIEQPAGRDTFAAYHQPLHLPRSLSAVTVDGTRHATAAAKSWVAALVGDARTRHRFNLGAGHPGYPAPVKAHLDAQRAV